MFLPIIIDPFAFDDMRYMWVYQKNLYHAYKNGSAIIAQARYAENREVWSDELKARHQFRSLTPEEDASVDKYFIPETIFDDLREEQGSELGAKLFLLTHRYPPLEEVLEKFFDQISAKEKIEGVFNWAAHTESVKYVANKRGIPVLTSEFSLRFPNYRPLCYLSYGDILQETEIAERYQKFLSCRDQIDFELFSRRELLALFLDDSVVNYLRCYKMHPQYEVGVAGLHPLISTLFAKTTFTDLELAQNVRKNYAEKDILFRKHPGEEPYQATYGFRNLDTHKSPIPFILNSRRIAAQGSNIIFEAMLWNRGVYSRDGSPFAQFAERDFSERALQKVDETFLNFVLFCYFIPMEKLWDPDYLRWRNTGPSETDIFARHTQVYFGEKNISADILRLPKHKRLKALMKIRGL